MARKGGCSTQRSAPSVVTNGYINDNPPPSTIAAQIVRNASRTNVRQDLATKVSFGVLVKEFLQHPNTDDSGDPQLVALICVIAEAGLEALFKDDPFAQDQHKQQEQGIDSIAALTKILEQKPHLLLSVNESDGQANGSPPPPLFVWLFPKLLGLLTHATLQPLHEPAQGLLSLCLNVLARTSVFWRHAAALRRFYKAGIQDTLTELDLASSPTMLLDPSFRVTLPSSGSIAELWPESQHIVALTHNLQKTITSPIIAIHVGFNLLFAFVKAHDRDRGQRSGSAASDHLSSWILDTCLALWQHFIRWTTSNNKGVIEDGTLTLYLRLLGLVVLPTTASEDGFSTSTKAALSLVTSLTYLIEEASVSLLSDMNQIQLALLFIRLRNTLNGVLVLDAVTKRRQETWTSIVLEGIETSVNKVCQNAERISEFHKDLQLSLCLWLSPGSWPINITELRKELFQNASKPFSDPRLIEESISLLKEFGEVNQSSAERPAKRRKTFPESAQDINESTYNQLVAVLNGSSQDSPMLDLSNLHNTVKEQYAFGRDDTEQKDSEKFELQRLEVLSALGKIACAGSRCLETSITDSQHWKTLNCTLCGTSLTANRGANVYWNNGDYGEDWMNIIAAMLAITKEREFQRSPKSRILMAIAVGRVFNHISDPGYLDLENCELGQWLLTSMRASLRELKIAAMSSLMVFLRNSIASGVRQKNRRFTLEVIDAIASKNVISDQETIIMAYGQIARVCGEFEFPIILHRLIEYLEHTNALVCGMAYREIESLADEFAPDPLKLLSPYWRIIGFSAFKDVVKKPQKATQLADLTEQSVNQLLLLTQADILPTLVLTGRREVVERIAKIRKASVIDVLTQPKKNTAKVLALLLSQPVEDVAAEAMKTLAAIEPTIRERIGNRLEALIAPDPDGIAVEILLLAADQDESKRKFFHRGFNTLAMLADSKSGQRKSKTRSLDDFLESHILGIITHLSNIIESPLAQGKTIVQPLSERKRCIAAIGELMTLAHRSVNVALPQLRACLQSAMADPELVDETFSVWCAFLTALEADDVMLVVDQTFALVVQHWASFSEETQIKANKFIVDLTQQYDALLRERIEYLPSLASIPIMSKTEGELVRLKAKVDTIKIFRSFSNRCKDQNAIVVRQALRELVPFLDANQEHLHQSIVGQKPIPILASLTRSLLDASVRFSGDCLDITVLCAQCLGIIGGLDPHRVETVREKKRLLVLTNFANRDEDINFVALLLEQVLVKVFLSTTNPKAQGWIAYVMQEMLRHSGFKNLAAAKPRSSQTSTEAQRWNEIPESVKNVLTPFLDSKYSINVNPSLSYESPKFPIYNNNISHGNWLQRFVYDLLQKGQGPNVEEIFPVLARIIRGYDLSIATFILPFAALNVIVSDDEQNMQNVGRELLTVLESEIVSPDQLDASTIRQCSENVFQTLDYLSLWLQEKKKAVADARVMASKTGRGILEEEEMAAIKEISRVEGVLQMIPAEVISRRAVECGSYARALFHWEQYYRQQQKLKADTNAAFLEKDELLDHLQMIYAQIDEPDCMEGISAHLKVLNPEQQIIEDRKAGRWTAAQTWYEIALAEKPNDLDTQINLLTCLKESGQYDAILNYVDGFHASKSLSSSTLPFAAEAAWSTGKWDQLERILATSIDSQSTSFLNFNVGVGQALLCLQGQDTEGFAKVIPALRESVAKSLSPSVTVSVQACHDHLIKLHALYEIETISGVMSPRMQSREVVLENLDRRLDIIGAYTSDKQYILGIRRAAMSSSPYNFTKLDIASAWLTTARLARKGGFINTAFNSVLHANRLGDNASKIEYSKLLWKEGHHRRAIQNLSGAIDSNAFQSEDVTIPVNVSVTTAGRVDDNHMNRVKSHAQLLLAKWLDRAGQTQSQSLKDAYAKGVMSYSRWDKGHYYLARYYLKLLESEKKSPVTKQGTEYLSGSLTKLVVENFVRSTVYGTKYYYQTLPKVLTLWLDMGIEVMNNVPRSVRDKELHEFKLAYLEHLNKYLKRYATERMPAFAWYTAFPQIITRISHPNKNVWDALQTIIIRVASTYPQQALWSLLAVLHSTQDDRRSRGTRVLQLLRDASRKKGSADLKNLIIQGQRLTDGLLAACDAPVEQRVTHVSLSRDLGFSHKLAPSQLVVPIEANMLPNLPAGNDSATIRRHNPFPQDAITINAFMDDVLVLSSLQRPRKVNVRGSDGRSYGLLCKPKDDLRKDQRLMEFNTMINRALQKDISSSKRRLYIKTYAVTPLNEECGTIEWVEGLKPMRDIILRFYRQHNVPIDYTELRVLLNEASSSPSKVHIFTEKILGQYTPVLHEWFVETFPEPEAWFAARLRYTRSCAVMSIVGHVLGLGDRHGENVLLEQGDGGTFHVDFNCLFDKGLTFEKPELVPFRLTHNMVDAMGPQGVEGPFRKAAELTYNLLRQHEDTLITILETFVHDPTADFLGGRKRKKIAGVADTPQEVLDIVRIKVNGYLKGESVPLSVEGYVEALIAMARDPMNLASMYIGWCAFF